MEARKGALQMTQATSRVVVAESAELVRRGICDVLGRDSRLSVVDQIARPEDVARAALDLVPDVILFGLTPSEGSGADSPGMAALRNAVSLNPSVRVIVLIDSDDIDVLLAALRAGVKGALLRDASADVVLEAVSNVLDGAAALDPRLARALFEYLAGLAGPSFDATGPRLHPAVLRLLSPREREVLAALARGKRNKEIGAELGVSVGTVKTHLRHIFRKLTVADRTSAALTALQARLPDAA